MSTNESCIICKKNNACILCCGCYFCLMDFFGSIHSSHFENAKIIDKKQFNKDIGFCMHIKEKIEEEISNDISKINKENNLKQMAAQRHVDNMGNGWDVSSHKKEVSSTVIDMTKLPSPPSIQRAENDTFPVIMAKSLSRTLQYRFDYLPQELKQDVMNYYYKTTYTTDLSYFNNYLNSIVMQMISSILMKNEKGELWLSKPNTEAYNFESKWPKEKRLKTWFRNLDNSLLNCDDCDIIRLILKQEVKDITEIDFSKYYSHMKDIKINQDIIVDQGIEVDRVCSKCGHNVMLKKSIRDYIPVSTHDEIWVNKDSVDYLVQFTCPKCGYSFQSENWLQ